MPPFYHSGTAFSTQKISMDTEYIYALIDPATNEPRYVGRTSNPDQRYKLHLAWQSEAGNSPKRQWIAALSKAGLRPLLQVLEEAPSVTADLAEAKWIKGYLDKGYVLTNIQVAAKYLRDTGRAAQAPSTGQRKSANPRETVSVRIPAGVMTEIRRLAQEDRRSVNSMIVILLRDGISLFQAALPSSSE